MVGAGPAAGAGPGSCAGLGGGAGAVPRACRHRSRSPTGCRRSRAFLQHSRPDQTADQEGSPLLRCMGKAQLSGPARGGHAAIAGNFRRWWLGGENGPFWWEEGDATAWPGYCDGAWADDPGAGRAVGLGGRGPLAQGQFTVEPSHRAVMDLIEARPLLTAPPSPSGWRRYKVSPLSTRLPAVARPESAADPGPGHSGHHHSRSHPRSHSRPWSAGEADGILSRFRPWRQQRGPAQLRLELPHTRRCTCGATAGQCSLWGACWSGWGHDERPDRRQLPAACCSGAGL